MNREACDDFTPQQRKSAKGVYIGKLSAYNLPSLLIAELLGAGSTVVLARSLKIKQPIGVGVCGAVVMVSGGSEIESCCCGVSRKVGFGGYRKMLACCY